MSRVASHWNNGAGQLSRSSSNSSTVNPLTNGGGRTVTVRSAAPPPTQKETVHACPLCNGPYKDPRVLPCTHTYCFHCIREKLLAANRLTCPKCQHQVEPFDENDLSGLQRNLILSQEWRLNTKPLPALPTSKKPVAYQPPVSSPSTQMPKQQDKRKSSTADSNGGIAALVNAFSLSGSGDRRSSRSSSVASTQPTVSNLVRIYSEATNSKQPEKARSDSVFSTGKHEELVRIFEQATHRSQRQETPTKSSIKRPSQAYEEITWDSLTHGTTPVAPPFPAQWQTATENIHRPAQIPDRPISAASSVSSDRPSGVNNLHEIISAAQHHSAHYQPATVDSRTHSRRSSYSSASELSPRQATPVQQGLIYATIQPPPQQQQHSRQDSYADSIHSVSSASTAKRSPPPSISNTYQQISSLSSPQRGQFQQQQKQQQQEEKASRTASVASSSRRSSERFPPPPPPQLETLDFGRPGSSKPRSTSSMSSRSSAYVDATETNFLSTERFNPDTDIPIPVHTHSSSQLGSRSSTPSNRSPSKSVERETPHLAPIPAASLAHNVNSRVEILLSDQKRLEREIEEQVRRLKHDYEDVRRQIERKETALQHEVKNITSRLDEDITAHYHQKQKIYAELAADTNSVGHQLERLKSSGSQTDKQQLWASLEQIESSIQNIRRAVEQQREAQGALSFAEGHRRIASDTIGQLTFPHRSNAPPPIPSALPPTRPALPVSANITPYKYLKIDHLATLEPEAMAITENNKKILLGICNKLFILDEYGTTINVIPLTPSIRGIAVSKKAHAQNIAYVSHDETVSIINIETGQTIDSVKETDSSGQSGVFLPLGIDTDHIRGDVYVCDYRNSCVLKFDDKLEFLTQWRIYNHYEQYDEARPKLISVQGQRFYMIVEHSCKPYYDQGIAYTFSLHICDVNSGNIIKIIDADLLGPQRLRWPCSIQVLPNERCYVLDTMTSGKYFNGQWQRHWSRVLELSEDDQHPLTELFQLDSEAATMAMTKENMIIAANGDILFVNLAFLKQQQQQQRTFSATAYDHEYQNLP